MSTNDEQVSVVWKVDLWESERGFGQKLFHTEEFTGPNAKEKAYAYFTAENAKNNKGHVPDWYVFAREPYAEARMNDGTVLRNT